MIALLRLRWLFNKRVSLTLLWSSLLMAIAIAINMTGIRLAGDIESWMQWLNHYAVLFLVWRMALYLAVGYGWYWMRQRLLKREAANQADAKARFIRIEIATIIALLVLEISQWTA